MPDALPVGPPVPEIQAKPPVRGVQEGRWVLLRPIEPAADAVPLFEGSHGSAAHARIWTYMAYGPFPNPDSMKRWLETLAPKEDPLFFAVCNKETGTPLGMVSFLNVFLEMRRLELGHIWYGLQAQRTKVNTEAIYLMLTAAFEAWQYRRVEWKCDALNARSQAAAQRLGFQSEGLFRKHMIVKGRSRDTAWFAMMDDDWPHLKPVIETWLYGKTPGGSLREMTQRVLSDQ